MTPTTILDILLALFKAIPALEKLWEDVVTLYVAARIATMKRENKDAIRVVLEKHDQRPIEDQLGSDTAGKPTGLGEIRDTLPGVPKP